MTTSTTDPEEASERGLTARRVWTGVILGVGVSLALAIWSDLGELAAALARFPLTLLGLLVLLTAGNQALRFVRWQRLLDALDVDLPTGASARIFTSGLAMILTPGKLGEVWKGWLVREENDTPLERTVPVVGIERLTDVLGLLALSLVGVVAFGGPLWLWIALTLGLLGATALLRWEGFVLGVLGWLQALPLVGRLAGKLESFYRPSRALLEPRPFGAAMSLSVVGWALECLGMWLVLHGLGVDVSLAFAAFVFAAASILGAVSMLPGGLGVTEASMVGLLVQHGIAAGTATAATLLIRLTTLWFVAGVALLVHGAHRADGLGSARPEGST
jgi:uncharacterized protein (TIRG00374 family)